MIDINGQLITLFVYLPYCIPVGRIYEVSSLHSVSQGVIYDEVIK